MTLRSALPVRPTPVCEVGGVPIAYEVLGVQVHLEELSVGDEDTLGDAMALVLDWVGDRLKWSVTTMDGTLEPFDSEVLDYATTYPRLLSCDPREMDAAPDTALQLMAPPARDYGISCGDTELALRQHAQVTSFRFYADADRYTLGAPQLTAHSIIRVTVPADTSTEEFQARSRALVQALPVRWASAGLMLSGAEDRYYKDWKRCSFAHCRRHWGVDHGAYIAWLPDFYHRVRTVNWLTYLGPNLREELEQAGGKLAPVPGVSNLLLANGALELQGGVTPQRGDINRLNTPTEYAAVDAMIRQVRHQGSGISFHEAWDERTSTEWLRRFERK